MAQRDDPRQRAGVGFDSLQPLGEDYLRAMSEAVPGSSGVGIDQALMVQKAALAHARAMANAARFHALTGQDIARFYQGGPGPSQTFGREGAFQTASAEGAEKLARWSMGGTRPRLPGDPEAGGY